MRNFIFILSFLLFQQGFSQSKAKPIDSLTSFTITKSKLAEVKLLSDIIPSLPLNYETLLYDITFKKAGVINQIKGSGMEVKSIFEKQISKAQRQSKIFIDLTIHIKKKSYKRIYAFFVQ